MSAQRGKPNHLNGLQRRLSRMRHFRGHGIHSPYIYRIAREVLLTRRLFEGCDRALYEALGVESSLKERYRVELQNIYSLYDFDGFALDRSDAKFVVYTTSASQQSIEEGVESARTSGTTIAILNPRWDRQRETMCERIIDEHHCTTLYREGYLLIFNNHLPKQHFQL